MKKLTLVLLVGLLLLAVSCALPNDDNYSSKDELKDPFTFSFKSVELSSTAPGLLGDISADEGNIFKVVTLSVKNNQSKKAYISDYATTIYITLENGHKYYPNYSNESFMPEQEKDIKLYFETYSTEMVNNAELVFTFLSFDTEYKSKMEMTLSSTAETRDKSLESAIIGTWAHLDKNEDLDGWYSFFDDGTYVNIKKNKSYFGTYLIGNGQLITICEDSKGESISLKYSSFNNSQGMPRLAEASTTSEGKLVFSKSSNYVVNLESLSSVEPVYKHDGLKTIWKNVASDGYEVYMDLREGENPTYYMYDADGYGCIGLHGISWNCYSNEFYWTFNDGLGHSTSLDSIFVLLEDGSLLTGYIDDVKGYRIWEEISSLPSYIF